MSMDDEIGYSGPNGNYAPETGYATNPGKREPRSAQGYHDLAMLRDLLKEIERITEEVITTSEKELDKYTLRVEGGTKLSDAQSVEWPSDLGETKDYVSYTEYKYLQTRSSRGAAFIRKAYEDNLRGPAGTTALDVLDLSDVIRQEAVHITNFLDTYLGDVNDSSEYRTVELFQDWAHNALFHARTLRGIVQEESKNTSKIPASELGQISSQQAEEYQLLFRAKMNALNNDLLRTQEQFHKEFSQLTPIYHKKFLGPALNFRLKATRGLEQVSTSRTFLGAQAQEAVEPLNASLEVMLADQMERNQLFYDKMKTAIDRVQSRDRFGNYIKQLEVKGKKVKNPFSTTPVPAEETEYFKRQIIINNETTTNTFESGHSLLDGTDEPDAHPQYLKSAGDTITGEILFDVEDDSTTATGPEGEPLPFDGMRPGGRYGHRHLGVEIDGTRQLSAVESLEAGTLAAALVDIEEQVIVPDRLRFVSRSTSNRFGLTDLQFAWDDTGGVNVNQYEVQLVRVPVTDDADAVCVVGHSGAYSTNGINSESDRIYINNGLETGYYNGYNPIISPDVDYDYTVTTADADTLFDKAFIVAYDANSAKDIRVAIGTRARISTTRWDQAGEELEAASITTGAQGRIAITSALPSLALLGCLDDVDGTTKPTVKLIQAEYSYTSSPPTSSIEVAHTNALMADVSGVSTFHGIYGIEIGFYNTFLVAYGTVESGNDKLYINTGKISTSSGSDTYDITRITESNAEVINDNLAIKDVQIKALSTTQYLVLYGLDDGDSSYNWYVRLITINIQTAAISDVGDPVLIADGTALGVPSISIINSSNFFVVWAEEDAG